MTVKATVRYTTTDGEKHVDTVTPLQFRRLPTLAEMRARPLAQPKPSRLERAVKEKKADGEDARKLREWAMAVKQRDEYIDRYTDQRTHKTAAADPDRAEAHHIVGRADQAVRHDVRNGICVSWRTHERLERGELEVVGTHWFTLAGKRYIDATHRVTFKEHK